LTATDRAVGWDERFAAVCIDLLEEVRVSLVIEKRMPKWIAHHDMIMYFENPGILSGVLRDDILELTRDLSNI
jgi:hypothetical protein